MGKLTFSDGVEIDTSGELRVEKLSDGFYVTGEGLLSAVDGYADGQAFINKLKGRKKVAVPETFVDFRKILARLVKPHHGGLSEQIGDVDYEGGELVNSLWSCWESIEYELQEESEEKFKCGILCDNGDNVSDAILEAFWGYSNAWEYGPGEAPKAVSDEDAKKIATKVGTAWEELWRY